eukprot:Skav226065  [mRNA]  locus=scaffold211:563780:568420:- [translate_table: standard]
MIVGDFNAEVVDLPSWQLWEQLGCRDLKMMYQAMYHQTMPPTCQAKTWPDNGIICPLMQRFVCGIEVQSCPDFPTHSPVLLTLQSNDAQPLRPSLSMPKTFLDFDLPDETLQSVSSQIEVPDVLTIESWGEFVEDTIDLCLHRHSQLNDGRQLPATLPKAYRGRCQPRMPTMQPFPTTAKPSRSGDYQLDTEVTHFGGKSRLKQLRRIQSLLQQLRAHAKDDRDKSERSVGALQIEWNTILRSRAFGAPFHEWVSCVPELGPPQWPLPTVDWLFQLQQFVQFEVERHLVADRLMTKKFKQFQREQAQKLGSKEHFAYLRNKNNSVLHELSVPLEVQCQAEWNTPNLQVQLHLSPEQVSWGTPLVVNNLKGWMCSNHGDVVTVQFPADTPITEEPPEVTVQQHHAIHDPNEIYAELNKFWEPLWNSTWTPSEQHIAEFEALVAALPLRIPVEVGVEQWKEAIRSIRGNTAKGFDGLSAWELKRLPDVLVELLSETMLQYPKGYPEWFMRARTVPVSKTDDIPTSKQIRPITILPVLYRIYASITCRQILRRWNQVFPTAITGLLPTRGSHDAAYAGQFLLERAAETKQALSGLTLDIQKCFNQILHFVGPILLRHLGVPQEFVDRWIGSIKNMTRFWLLHEGTFGPIPTSRGFPEGDTHSVLTMLSIAVLWVYDLFNIQDDTIAPTAYADNWGWTTMNHARHEQAAQRTVYVTSLCGLSLDWHKTWFFASTTEAAFLAKRALAKALPAQAVERLHHAKDLGFEMRYSGAHRIGHRKDRYQHALQRLKRLSFLQTDADEKEKLWLVSVFPQGFYGSEICPPSQAVLKQFRSKAADSIYGASQSMNPALALFLGRKHVLDPGYLVVWKAIISARRWLARSKQKERYCFYRMTSQFQGGLSTVKGPASALALYLNEVVWQLDNKGNLHVGPFTTLHILDTPQRTLRRALTIAWQSDLLIKYSERSHLYHLSPISRIDTVALLNKFNSKDRACLVRELAGAFQTQHQQSQWQEEADGTCPFCKLPDSRHHRIFECPAMSEARQPFQRSLQWLEDEGFLADLPVVHAHPDEEAHQVLQHREPWPIIGPSFFQFAKKRRDADLPLHMYTDGSCLFADHPSSRIAGFAVVIDLCETDEQRKQVAQMYFDSGPWREYFQVLCQSRLQGDQDIGRAEFAALEVTARFPGTIYTRTDSQVCIADIQRICRGDFDWVKGNNIDIAERISMQLHHGHFFLKIKAHQTPTPSQDRLEVFHILGNTFADECAKATCLPSWSPFTQHLHDRHQQQDMWREHVFQLYKCFLALQSARIRAEQNKQLESQGEELLEAHRSGDVTLHVLAHYDPPQPATFEFPAVGLPLFEAFPWGPAFADMVKQWYENLVWPGQPPQQACCRAGVSWLEVGLSLSLTLGAALPVIRSDTAGRKRLIHISTRDDLRRQQVTLADISTMAQLILGHFLAYIQPQHLPIEKRGLNRALIWVGFRQHTCGFCPRPRLPFQKEILAYLSNHVTGKNSFDVACDFDWVTDVRKWPLTEGNWCELRDRSYRLRRKFWQQLL